MATSKIKNGTVTKLYSGKASAVTNSWYYVDADLTADIAQYGDPIGAVAYTQYNNVCVACVAGTNLRMLTTVQGLNVYAKVTFSK